MSNRESRTAGDDDSPRRSSTHDVEREGHDTRADEMSEEHAAHLELLAAEDWDRPSALLAPEPRPGMDQRWVRVSVRGAGDPRNVGRKRRDGWKPRPADTISDEWFIGFTDDDGKAKGYLQQDELVLMERPIEISQHRARYFADRADAQMAGVEHDLEDTIPAHQMHTRRHRSRARTGVNALRSGRQVQAADDD